MSGLTVNDMTREQVAAAVRAIPKEKFFVWDGIDEDDRPLSDAELKAGLEAALALRKQEQSAASDKTPITLQIDNDTLAGFCAMGADWQLRMNQALDEWISKAYARPVSAPQPQSCAAHPAATSL